MYRLRVSTLKAKQLKELKLKKEFRVIIRFAEKNIKKYYKIVAK